MRKFIPFLLFILIASNITAQINPSLVDIPHKVFVNGGHNDFKSILYQDPSIKEKVKVLFTNNELSEFEFNTINSEFSEFWEHTKDHWFSIKFHKNQSPLLLFKGQISSTDEREYVKIYNPSQKEDNILLFSSVGRLLAYKHQPFTEGIILYVHQYPCCHSASHIIYRIREINNKLQYSSNFFVGRDDGVMVGQFFPEKVTFSSNYHELKEKTELRWSPEVVEKDAFQNRTPSNLIIHYTKGALYKLLYDNGEWEFVLFLSGIAEEQSSMLNYTNFKNRGVYGWIKK